jgi:CelD/BcsL family acetyltransferase involved in cellulose biosynthesis
MRVSVVPAERLHEAHVTRWDALQLADPKLRSPFFHPAYTREAAEFFPGVEVAVLDNGGEPLGYFPFQRTPGDRGVPVGGAINDFQGIVARPGTEFDAARLIRDCGLCSWRFSQLVTSQRPFQRYHWITADSPSMDLREGFAAYARRQHKDGHTLISRMADKVRRAEREIGPVRFEAEARDPGLFDLLVQWKTRQYARIRAANPLAQPETLAFFRRLMARGEGDFRGVLSALYFRDRPAALHFGIRCRDVLHLWFPAYDTELGRYSPGIIHFVEQGRAAEATGISRADFGTGNERFKASFRNDGMQVAIGAVGLGVLASTMQRELLRTKNWVLASRFREPARAIYRGIRGLLHHGARHESN